MHDFKYQHPAVAVTVRCLTSAVCLASPAAKRSLVSNARRAQKKDQAEAMTLEGARHLNKGILVARLGRPESKLLLTASFRRNGVLLKGFRAPLKRF